MAKRRKPSRSGRQSARDYPRTARLSELIREIAADTLERLDDERLGLLTIQSVDVDAELDRAVVYYVQSATPTDDPEEFAEALDEARRAIKRDIAQQARVRRTPEVVFRNDEVVESASRVEEILRTIRETTDDLE